jgi:hypothetical protein
LIVEAVGLTGSGLPSPEHRTGESVLCQQAWVHSAERSRRKATPDTAKPHFGVDSVANTQQSKKHLKNNGLHLIGSYFR